MLELTRGRGNKTASQLQRAMEDKRRDEATTAFSKRDREQHTDGSRLRDTSRFKEALTSPTKPT